MVYAVVHVLWTVCGIKDVSFNKIDCLSLQSWAVAVAQLVQLGTKAMSTPIRFHFKTAFYRNRILASCQK